MPGQQRETGGEADEAAEGAGVEHAHQPGVLALEDRHLVAERRLGAGDVVHPEPGGDRRDDDEGHPDEAGVLQPERGACGGGLRLAAQAAEHRHGDRQRHQELHDAHAQVAQPGVQPHGGALGLFGEEERDVRHARGEVAAAQAAQQREDQHHQVGRLRVLHGEADPQRRHQQRGGGQRRPAPAAEDRHHEAVEDAQGGAGQAGQSGQPEQLVGAVVESGQRQLGYHHRPDHPDGEGQQQVGNGYPQVARGDALTGLFPESRIFRMPFTQYEAAGGGQLRQVAAFAVLGPFHALGHADRVVHPDQGAGGDQEQQHEAALPDANHIVEHAEGQRQEEAAETAHHPHQTADHADVLRVVGGDVLEHRRLAQGHEEAQHDDDQGEADQTEMCREFHLAAYASDDVAGRRVAEQEGADHRYAQGPVHHLARAVAVRQPAAEDAEQRGGHRIQRSDEAGGSQPQAVHLHQVVRQPQSQSDEGAEYEEVVQREAPDPQLGQRRQLLGQWNRAGLTGGGLRVVLRQQDEQDAREAQHQGIHQRGPAPTQGQHQEGGSEVGQAGADVTGAEDAQRGTLPARFEPGGGVARADNEAATRQPHAQSSEEQHREAVGEGQQVHAHG
ncbi:hypothetical protein D3C81_932180 [compost metagenome]